LAVSLAASHTAPLAASHTAPLDASHTALFAASPAALYDTGFFFNESITKSIYLAFGRSAQAVFVGNVYIF
jgi:hypothetical protein